MFWIGLSRWWPRWREALCIVKPETVLAWHRAGFRTYWRSRSRGKPGRPRIPRAHIAFIRRMSSDHPEWGEDRISQELKLKFGVDQSTSTERRYLVEDGPSSSSWRAFLGRHSSENWAIDFTTVALWDYTLAYVFVVIADDSRRIVQVGVTRHPTLAWVKQQLRDAMPFDTGPRYVIHDNDGRFGQPRGGGFRSTLDAWLSEVMGVTGVPIPYGAPNANAICERFMGTLRREALMHFIFLSEGHLSRVVQEFVDYYNEARPHQGIEGIPHGGPCANGPPPDGHYDGQLEARPVLGGVHHDYRLAA